MLYALPRSAGSTAPALDTLSPDLLTLEERGDLERAVDGPITPAMIADKLRERTTPTLEAGVAEAGAVESGAVEVGASLHYLRALIIWARGDLRFYRAQLATLESEIAALIADRDALYGADEKDRKTRHIAALNTQREALMRQCAPYQWILRDAARKLADAQTPTRE